MTCTQAIMEVFAEESGVLSASEVIRRVYARHPDRPWKEGSIRAHLMGLSVNHPSSHHYPSQRRRAFLYYLGSGRYRRWDREHDTIQGDPISGELQEPAAAEDAAAGDVEELHAAALDTSLSLERDLERTLLVDLGQLEPGLRLYQEKGFPGQQLDTGAVGRLDLLAVDAQGDLVVIELKAGPADYRVCGQILRYMGWVGENLAGDRKVRGIVVASEFDDSVRYAARAMPGVALKRYEVRFEFANV